MYSQAVNVGATTSFAVSGLASATKYHFVVQSYNDYGEFSGFSTAVTGTTAALPGGPSPQTAPPAPHSLAMALRDAQIIDLTWQASAAAPAYRIDVGTASGSSDVGRFTTGTTTSLAIGDLPPRTYYIRVRGANDAGVSAPTNEVIVPGPGGPDAPRDVSVLIRSTSARLAWAPPTNPLGVIGYSVEVGSAPGRKDLGSTTVATREISIPGIANRMYFVRVRALKTSGAGPPSNERVVQIGNFVTCKDPPRAPTLVAQAFGNMVKLSWSVVGGEAPTGFLLDVGTSPGQTNVLTAQFAASTTTVWAPSANGTYAFRLRAVNACGASKFAPDATVNVGGTTPALPGPPVGVKVNVSGASMLVTWSPPLTGGATTRYVIEVTDVKQLPVVTIDTRNTIRAFMYDGVPPGEYSVRVRAANVAGAGALSTRVSVVIEP
jgi:predicted phage tail protein